MMRVRQKYAEQLRIAAGLAGLTIIFGLGCLSPEQAGLGDCSSDASVGLWHQVNTPSNRHREHMTFHFDCGVQMEEFDYDRTDSGWFIQEDRQVAIDFMDYSDRTGTLMSENSLYLNYLGSENEDLTYERQPDFPDEAELLSAHSWQMVRFEDPNTGEDITPADFSLRLGFRRTWTSGGIVSTNGEPQSVDRWRVSDSWQTQWTPTTSHSRYLIEDLEGYVPSSSGIVALDDSQLILQRDDDLGRLVVYEADGSAP